jgi:hypothetical protein
VKTSSEGCSEVALAKAMKPAMEILEANIFVRFKQKEILLCGCLWYAAAEICKARSYGIRSPGTGDSSVL